MESLAMAVRQYPEIVKFINLWKQTELERLPYAGENAAIQAGRSQILMEIAKLVNEVPAKLANAHR
jgi:hypothetical protein